MIEFVRGRRWPAVWCLALAMSPLTAVGKDALPAAVAPADQWPVARGSLQMTGRSAADLSDAPELLWQFKAGASFEAAAAIVDEVVYVLTRDGRLFALDFATGKEKWVFADPEEMGGES
ncbi:MAG: PQQ-binding-like beta-propeller repeat protein, partial [Planctomycetia bacterium]